MARYKKYKPYLLSGTIIVETEDYQIYEKFKGEYKVLLSGFWSEHRKGVLDWCYTTFGDPGRNKRCNWRIQYSEYPCVVFFRRDEDLLLFRLKWE